MRVRRNGENDLDSGGVFELARFSTLSAFNPSPPSAAVPELEPRTNLFVPDLLSCTPVNLHSNAPRVSKVKSVHLPELPTLRLHPSTRALQHITAWRRAAERVDAGEHVDSYSAPCHAAAREVDPLIHQEKVQY